MTNEDLEKQILTLRMTEIDVRSGIVDHLREIQQRSIWKELGCRSAKEYCEGLGYDHLETREIMSAIGAIVTSADMKSDEPSTQKRINALRAWRRERAKMEGVAAYRVFSNRTIMALATQCPKTLGDLLSVPGVGEKKLESYGKELLSVLRS